MDHEARFVLSLTKVFWYARFKIDVPGQMLTLGYCGRLAVTPDYPAAKFPFGAEGVELL